MNIHRKWRGRVLSVLLCLLTLPLAGQLLAQEPGARDTAKKVVLTPQQEFKPVRQSPTAGAKSKLPQIIITDLQINTRADGSWFWKAKVRNRGSGVIKSGELAVQTRQGTHNPKAPSLATGEKKIIQALQPGQEAEVSGNWSRCPRIFEFTATLRNLLSNKDIFTKKINPVARISLVKVKPVNIRWSAQEKRWNADITNSTDYSLKILVQGVLLKGGKREVVGEQLLTIAAGATMETKKFGAPQAAKGDELYVVLYQPVSEEFCQEKRGIGGWAITIPNSIYNLP
ncbi:MAG: hypothetical protein ABFR97_12005 [Thermodesulfobacteriota bacterium]